MKVLAISNLNEGESIHWTMNFMGISSPRHHDSLIDPSLFIIEKSRYQSWVRYIFVVIATTSFPKKCNRYFPQNSHHYRY